MYLLQNNDAHLNHKLTLPPRNTHPGDAPLLTQLPETHAHPHANQHSHPHTIIYSHSLTTRHNLTGYVNY